jgi:hypothetical protein
MRRNVGQLKIAQCGMISFSSLPVLPANCRMDNQELVVRIFPKTVNISLPKYFGLVFMYGTSYLKLILISTQQVMAKLSRKPRKM